MKPVRHYIERVERLDEERKAIADDIAAIYDEAKAEGHDKHAVKAVVKIRRTEDGVETYTDRSARVDQYLAELGMLPSHVHVHEVSHLSGYDPQTREFKSQGRIANPDTSPAESEGDDISAVQQGSAAVEAHSAHNRKVAGSTPAPATIHPDPHSQGVDGGQPHPSSEADRVKSDGAHSIAGQGGVVPSQKVVNSGHQDASASQVGNEPESDSGATADNFEPPAFLLKRDHAPLRPLCQRPESCGGYGRNHCRQCLKAAGEMEAA